VNTESSISQAKGGRQREHGELRPGSTRTLARSWSPAADKSLPPTHLRYRPRVRQATPTRVARREYQLAPQLGVSSRPNHLSHPVEGGSANDYEYARGDPRQLCDLSGRSTNPCGDLIKLGVAICTSQYISCAGRYDKPGTRNVGKLFCAARFAACMWP
jgi:hypothetical protein